MKDLIEALTILLKYGNPGNPTHCSHDQLTICGIDPSDVSDEDKKKLDELGFFVSDEDGDPCFISFRYGSA
jgi:hypothetical protein